MEEGCCLVLDVGKTNAKLTLWSKQGECLARRVRANEASPRTDYSALDIWGQEAWVKATIREFTRLGIVEVIAPVTHGAAAVLVRKGRVTAAPMDYEGEI